MAFEIFKRTIKDKAFSTILIALLLFLYIFWLASFYPSIKPMLSSYDQLMQNPTVQAMIGEVANMTTFSGYMTVEVFSYMGLVIGAFFIFMVASFVSGEIEQKSSELLLSLPVSRENIIVSRFLAIVPFTLLIVIAEMAAIYLGGLYIGENIGITWFAYGMLYMAVFILAVSAIGLFISSIMSDGRKAALISVGVLLAMFMIENIGSMVTSIDWARKLSLFHYAKMSDIINSHEISWVNLGVLIAVIIVFVALSVIAFRRRDINVS